jgi:hypothetical protein
MIRVTALAMALLSSSTMDASSVAPVDGYCGYLPTKACARDLGIGWTSTLATRFLVRESVVKFDTTRRSPQL